MNHAKKLLSVILVAILMLTLLPSAALAASSVKITWNANGGKIGTKTTTTSTVKKGAKIGKLPTTPKYTGYTFKGWYTKKSGGTKVTTATKPTKNVTYYAQWKRVLSAKEKELVGQYSYGSSTAGNWKYVNATPPGSIIGKWKNSGVYAQGLAFNPDGTYKSFLIADGPSFTRGGAFSITTGNWSVSVKGAVRITNYTENVYYMDGTQELNQKYDDRVYGYVIETRDGVKGLLFWSWFFTKD